MKRQAIYGIVAEFSDATELLAAIRRSREEGYRNMDAFTPYPIEEIAEELHVHDNRLPLIVLIGGIVGLIVGYALQYWTSVVDYPINIGGRPLNSTISFIPVTFECTILFAALAAVFGMLALNGLPMPYHPVFHAPRFAQASRDRFFLCIESIDPKFDREETRRFIERLVPRSVAEVDY